MKLWHDDCRPAPEGWVWARTNEEAIETLLSGQVEEISMDHDLGYHDVVIPDDPDELAEVLFLRGQSEQTGLQLAEWMVENDCVPQKVTVHSWNPDGARRIAWTIIDGGYPDPVIRPFAL